MSQFYTDQERIDAATMRIDAPIIGSGKGEKESGGKGAIGNADACFFLLGPARRGPIAARTTPPSHVSGQGHKIAWHGRAWPRPWLASFAPALSYPPAAPSSLASLFLSLFSPRLHPAPTPAAL